MAVIYNSLDGDREGVIRYRCLKCGKVCIGASLEEYCLDCYLSKGKEDARDDGELSQDSCK